MADPVPFRRPIHWNRLRADEATRVINERAKNTDNVIIGFHAFDRVEERSIVAEDIYWILRTGTAEGPPVLKDGEWKVIMVRRMPGTREAGVVTLIVEENEEVFVKTVEWMDWIR
jgi:hypothetical protein